MLLRPTTITTPDEWAKNNRIYPQTSGKPGPRDPFYTPYVVSFERAVHSGLYQRVVQVTAAQSGKTDSLLDIIGQRLDQQPAPILYVGPSADFNKDQFEPRLMALLAGAKSLSKKLNSGTRMKKTLKTVAGVKIRLAHAGSSTALKSDQAALALVDEYDEMMSNIRGQGDPLGLTEARGDTFADFVTAVASTTTQGNIETEIDGVSGLEMWKVGAVEEISSPIWRLWQSGTRHHWAWPCPHCDSYFIPRSKQLKWPKGATPAQARREAYLCCPECGCIIEETHKAAMNAKGIMIAPNQTIEDAKANRNLPDSNTWSCWTSGLCSPFVTWGVRAERYLKALLSAEEDKVQTIVNAGFGELYSPGVSGDLPDWKELLEHRLPYKPRTIPSEVIRLTMGVDVQKNSLYYVTRGWGPRGSSWLIENGILLGSTDHEMVWSDLAEIMMAPISNMYIEKVFIDSGFRPNKKNGGSEHKVYEFCRRHSFIASPTKGRDTITGKPYTISKIDVKPDGKKRPYSISLVHINSDFFKSLVHSRIKTPLDQAGAYFLHEDADEEYARQVLSEIRVVQAGNPRPKWRKIRKDNHFLDCESLAAAAGYALNVQAIPEETSRDDVAEKHTVNIDSTVSLGAIRDRFRNLGLQRR